MSQLADTDELIDIGKRIASLRQAHNMRQADLAKLLMCSKSTVCGYECGKATPDVFVIKKICKEFSVSSDYLLGLSPNAAGLPHPDLLPPKILHYSVSDCIEHLKLLDSITKRLDYLNKNPQPISKRVRNKST